ncbi:hypothetical protein G9A89_017129 [Geosiphon pyriformis]|nr:hypothetical protein G9A89_017129 [Geosiphon pyriformis]
MEEEYLVEETSLDYGEKGVLTNRDHNSTPKRPSIITTKALGKPLGKINFSGHNDNDNVLLDTPLELPSPLKNLFPVSVRRSFALDIGLDKVIKKSFRDKLIVVRKLFLKVNSFRGVSTLLKFSEIICAFFTFESSLVQATEKARAADILVNTDLKKSFNHSDQAVVVKEISVGTSAETVRAVLSEFGSVVLIKIQLIGLWQKAVVEFVQSDQADLVTARWSILIRKDAIRHRALLYTLPVGTNAHNIWDFIGSVGGKTCVINRHPITYARARCAIVCFDFAASIDAVMETTSILKSVNLRWAYLNSAKYAKCGNLGHTSLNCSVSGKTFPGGLARRILSEDDKSRLDSIYVRHSAPISHSVFFGSVLWANIIGESFFPPFFVCNGSASSGSSSEMKPTPLVSLKLNDRFATLEHSLASFMECIDKLAKKLNSSGPTVSQPSPESDIVMSKNSGVVTGSEAIVEVAVFNPLVMSKMEETLNNLSIMVMSLSAKMNNAGLLVWRFATCNVQGINISAKQADIVYWYKESGNVIFFIIETKLRLGIRSWIMNKFERVCVFSSELNKGFFGAGVAIIMNSSLACHVSKIKNISGRVISVWLLFKDKLSVTVLGLYADAFAVDRFDQTLVINSFIAKAVNSSTFVVFGRDFNENSSRKSASFKFCSDFGLVNSFARHLLVNTSTWSNSRNVVKVIDFIFVSKSLSSVVTGHQIEPASKFFDTDHNAVLVSIGLGGLLDTSLNSKFKIKKVGIDKWLHFKKYSLARFLAKSAEFNSTKNVVVEAADEVFSRCWFSKLDCLRNKHSSKFFKLKLLVVKLVKCLRLPGSSGTDYLIKAWSRIDEKKASSLCNMIDDGVSLDSILHYLPNIKKRYCRSKYIEFRIARDILIRKVIEKYMENFSSNKEHMIKSVLKHLFCKVVLNHLVIDNDLILLPDEVKSTYAPLDYVDDNAFCDVMSNISSDEFFWKHGNKLVLGGLLDITNACLVSGAVPETLTNTRPIALVETAWKILFKILSNRISLACSKFDVLRDNNFLVLKGTSTQTSIFAVGLIVEDTLEKDRELWLVLQDMKKAYDSVGWFHMLNSLTRIKMLITDFGLTQDYVVYDSLDQGEIFLPLLWRIFYDSLLCKVKKHKELYKYRLDSKFFSRSGKQDPKGGQTLFLAAGVFVDNTIWIGNSRTTTQNILNIASEFFQINNISINTDKTLQISGSNILIAKGNDSHRYLGIFLSTSLFKPSLSKAHSDIRFFMNMVLRKTVSEKQFLYLVLVVLQLIVCYRIQFTYVLLGVCEKWDRLLRKGLKLKANLPRDFLNEVLYYSELYGLKLFGHL